MKRFLMIISLLFLVPLSAQAKVYDYYDSKAKEYTIETDGELFGHGFVDAVAYRGKIFQLNNKNAVISTKEIIILQIRVPSAVNLRRELSGTVGEGHTWNLKSKDISEKRSGRHKVYTFKLENPGFLKDITGSSNQKKDIRFLATTTSGDEIDLVLPFWSDSMKDWREIQNTKFFSSKIEYSSNHRPSFPTHPNKGKPPHFGRRSSLWESEN